MYSFCSCVLVNILKHKNFKNNEVNILQSKKADFEMFKTKGILGRRVKVGILEQAA